MLTLSLTAVFSFLQPEYYAAGVTQKPVGLTAKRLQVGRSVPDRRSPGWRLGGTLGIRFDFNSRAALKERRRLAWIAAYCHQGQNF
jgi:hypothetical protein